MSKKTKKTFKYSHPKTGETMSKTIDEESKTNFRVLLDRSSIEIFFNNGEHVLSSYIDPDKKNKRIKIKSENNNKLNCNLNIMKSAWVN